MLACSSAHAQIPAPIDLADLMSGSEKANAVYTETFKNLSADETKVFEDYDKTGKLKETRRVKSIFIVYQSPRNGAVGELRNIVEYNGKAVTRKDKEITEFFEKVARSDSIRAEMSKVMRDGNRYDGRASAYGMTLWPESPFVYLKPFVEYKILGKENIEGRETIVVGYVQTKPTLLVKFNPADDDFKKEPNGRHYSAEVSSGLRPYSPFISGRIWLDAQTLQTWRNEFRVMLRSMQLSAPVQALAIWYEYQSSSFKILVPKKFVLRINKITGASDKDLSVTRDRVMTFEYSKFSEFKSETKDYTIMDKP